MSKGYNMAGWRIGFCAGNAEMIRALATIKGYYDYGIFQAVQIAAIVALRHGEEAVTRQAAEYQKRRDVLHAALREVFQKRDDSLRFQACLPLLRDFDDKDAVAYVLEQTKARDADRARTAMNWISDAKRSRSQKAESPAGQVSGSR